MQGLQALTIGTSGMVGTELADRHVREPAPGSGGVSRKGQVPKGQERTIPCSTNSDPLLSTLLGGFVFFR